MFALVHCFKQIIEKIYLVFGVPLVELMSKHEREKDNDIPSFIAEALDTIDATGELF